MWYYNITAAGLDLDNPRVGTPPPNDQKQKLNGFGQIWWVVQEGVGWARAHPCPPVATPLHWIENEAKLEQASDYVTWLIFY